MILIVQSQWNASISDALSQGAEKVLKEADISYRLLKCPGALEIPLAIQWASEKVSLSGAIACGCVIRGDTYHFDIVANESARLLGDLGLKLGIPIGNAILTVYDRNQAYERIGGKHGHKGEEAAQAVLQMLQIKKNFN